MIANFSYMTRHISCLCESQLNFRLHCLGEVVATTSSVKGDDDVRKKGNISLNEWGWGWGKEEVEKVEAETQGKLN